MALLLTNEQKVKLEIKPVTAVGNPAPVQNPVWSVSDSSVLTLDVAPDGLSAYAISNQIGLSQVNVVADGDLGEGVRELASSLEIQVVAAEAVSLGIVANAIETK